MKKTLTDRVTALEGRTDDIRDELNEVRAMVIQIDTAFEKHQKWLSNGFSDKIASVVTSKMAEQQEKQWEREREERRLQLEEQRIKNQAMGEERERKMKIWLGVLGAGGPIITAIGAAILWLATGGAK